MNRQRLATILAILSLVWLAACSSATPESGPSGSEIGAADEAAIYSAVIRQLAGPDDTFGGTLDKPVLYIERQTNDAAGDPTQGESEPRVLPVELQDAITQSLSDLPSSIVWVDSREQVEMDDAGRIADGGVIITLGNIHPQPEGEVYASGSIYVGNLAAGGKTYVLEETADGAWAVTGTTGAEWIS